LEAGDNLESLGKKMGVGRVLLGYSMGGRLAMAMLALGGWDGAILVSCHPGLTSEAERRARLASDRTWAERFETEPWEAVVSAWNSQAVFAGDAPSVRKEADFDRHQLALALRAGSLGVQPDYRPMLAGLAIPVLWMAGELDEKYVGIGRECAGLNPGFEFVELPRAGHRAPWGNPVAFGEAVTSFLERNELCG
jgi:2-succinyl-6-hydroxy-2,4-cyclohexadiene-1-carboxylate synthase